MTNHVRALISFPTFDAFVPPPHAGAAYAHVRTRKEFRRVIRGQLTNQ